MLTPFLTLSLVLSIVNTNNPIEITINNHRNQAFCELVELTLPTAILWTSLTQHDCPQSEWNDIKNNQPPYFFIVPTRYITRDTTIIHFESAQLEINDFIGSNPNHVLSFLRESEFGHAPISVPSPFVPFSLEGFDVSYIWNQNTNIHLLIESTNGIKNYYIMSSSSFPITTDILQIIPDYEDNLPINWRLQTVEIQNDIINRGAFGINNKPILIRDTYGNNFHLLTPDSCSCDHVISDARSNSESDSSDDNAMSNNDKVSDSLQVKDDATSDANISTNNWLIIVLTTLVIGVIVGVLFSLCLWIYLKQTKTDKSHIVIVDQQHQMETFVQETAIR